MPDDSLTAALAEIRSRASMVNYAIACETGHEFSHALDSQSDVPRLLAAVEAVLALAQGLTLPPGRATAGGLYGAAYEDAERQVGTVLREAISRALLGEDGTDGT